MSFPSVQQAPVYTPVAGSMPQQTAYIQQGQCGNCGVTLIPYPQTQLNQGDSGQYQMSAQGNIQSSGGTLQDSHQFAQASGQSYVGGQQQVETAPGQVQSSQQSVVEASAGEAAPAEADAGKTGFDFAAFLSPLNKDEREARAKNAAKAVTGPQIQSEQSQTGQAATDQASPGQAQTEQAQAGYGQSQMTGQIQGGGAGSSQGAQAQSGQAPSDQSQTAGQIQGSGSGYSKGGQVQSSHTQASYTGPVQSGQVPGGAGSGQSGQLSSSDQPGQAQQPDASAARLAVQQYASAPAGGQSLSHSSQPQSQASSVPYQAFAGLSTQKMHVALSEMDHEISELTMSTVDRVALAYDQTLALAGQQRAFLQEHGALPKDVPCASCGHFEIAKQPPSSSGANVQQKQSDTTKNRS